MNAGRRTTWIAVFIGCALGAAHAQTISTTATAAATTAAPVAPAAPEPSAPAVPPTAAPADAASIANTTAALPPPAALPGSTVQALGATGSSNLSRPDFSKAIWVDATGPALRTPDGIKKMVADCRDAGFDTIYAQVRANGDALYATTLAPTALNLPAGYDALKLLLEEAKSGSRPLQVHALLVAYRVWSSSTEAGANHVAKQHPDWLTLAEDGSNIMEITDTSHELWLDPGVIAAQDHLALIAADLVKNYAVDGIQLDRIRYPELEPRNASTRLSTGYAPAAVDRYNQEKSKSGKPRPTDVDWVNWRRGQVTETVRKIREAARAVRPTIHVSVGAITFGSPPASREEYVRNSTPYTAALQDWVGWAEQGIIDSNVLMNFKSAERGLQADFELWQEFALGNKGKAKVVIGVGGFLNDPRYTAAQMLLPLFQPRADGVALYGYNDTYKDRTHDGNLTYLRPVLDAANVDPKANAISAAVATPVKRGAAAAAEQMAKLDAAAVAAGVDAPGTAVAPAVVAAVPASAASTPSGVPTLPQLGSSAAANMPSLATAAGSTASSGAGGLPNLSAAASAPGSTVASLPDLPGSSPGTAPSLPSLSAGSTQGSMPSLSAATAGAAMPSLSSVNQSVAGTGTMPSLPDSGGTVAAMPALPGAPAASATALPPITEVVPGASSGSPMPPLGSIPPASSASPMPALPSSQTVVASAPSLPSLSAPALPTSAPSGSVAVAETTPEANKVVPQVPDMVAPIAPLNPLATPEPGNAFAIPSMSSAVVPQSANASVTIEPPLGTPITSIAPIPGGPATTSLSVPGTSAKTSVNIPSLGGSTNFDGKAIAAAAPASPLITPPTVLTPAPGQTNTGEPINVGKQTVMDAPVVQRIEYAERQSAYGTPNPAYEIRNYTTANIRKERHDTIAMPPAPTPLEVIVLKSGKEFAGRVLQRGLVWRIQLPNGSVMNIPGEKIASTRSTESSPLSVAVTPIPL